mgnify:FL=1
MNIDDIADSVTRQDTPGEIFHSEWLSDLPESQWPSYIDQNARLVADGIVIGSTELTKGDFAPETGEYYQKGLAASAGINIGETSLPLGQHNPTDIGRVAWSLNRLRDELSTSEYTDLENPSRAVEAVLNKRLVAAAETGDIDTANLGTIRLPEDASVTTLVSEVFCRPRRESYVSLLVDTVADSETTGLLNRIDEPRMITELWDHQRSALTAWLEHECRGYVDMATATGKTFLGLAAIAHHFGSLHPADTDIFDSSQTPDYDTDDRATVLIVAHRDLILDQWQREFDTHLNIPERRQTRDSKRTATFEWGDVHFWTPNRLQERGVPETDLIILDEAHHYLGGSGFGGLLDEMNGDILALSGSLDSTNARTLKRRDIPKLFEFSLRDGQRAGVIPQFDWDVIFTPYRNQAELADVTTECRDGIETFGSGIDLPDGVNIESESASNIEAVSDNNISFDTLSEARSLVQSSVGRELKEADPEFRSFASAVMGRQLTRYNLSPALSTVVDLTLDHINQHKCVVLLETEREIEYVTDELASQLGESYESLITVLDSDDALSTVRAFDMDADNGALIGVAQTLGEGVDIETADVCINRSRGRLSRSLVQRMGRVLRNPQENKYAQFFHVMGVPTRDGAILPREDGVELLETASQLLAWGDSFDARPVFRIDPETYLSEDALSSLEIAGVNAIDTWTPDQYEWPEDDDIQSNLESLCDRATDIDGSALMSIERQSHKRPATADSYTDTNAGDDIATIESGHDIIKRVPEAVAERDTDAPDQSTPFVSASDDAISVPAWLCRLIEIATTDDLETFAAQSVRSHLQESLTLTTVDADDADQRLISDEQSAEQSQLSLNPALESLVTAYTAETDASKRAVVETALASTIMQRDDVETLIRRGNLAASQSDVTQRLESLSVNT